MKELLKSWSEPILEALIIIVVMYFVFFPFKVSGVSMNNTLNDGDKVFASRIVSELGFFNKGDIIIFEKTIDGMKIDMVKRIIALENDTVSITGGELYVNGILQCYDYIVGETAGDMEITLGKGEIFVMGDNRDNSIDSRYYGTITKDEVVGRVILKALPISDFQVFL